MATESAVEKKSVPRTLCPRWGSFRWNCAVRSPAMAGGPVSINNDGTWWAMKKCGQCKLCKDKPIDYTKSDIVPKWFIRGFKDGPNGGYYINLLGGKPGEIGERGDAYFVDDEALCKKCNNERLSAWEEPSKAFY